MKNAAQSAPLTLPPALLAEVEAAADEEHRSVGDVLRDLVERGLKERRWQAQAGKEPRRTRSVFRTEDLSDAEVKAITEGGMDSRHDYLNAELE